jgi:hypothetical protein
VSGTSVLRIERASSAHSRLASQPCVCDSDSNRIAQVLNAAIATLERRHTAQDGAATAKLAALSERLSLVEEASSAWAERQVWRLQRLCTISGGHCGSHACKRRRRHYSGRKQTLYWL